MSATNGTRFKRTPRSVQIRGLVDDTVVEMREVADDSATFVTDAIHQACDSLSEDLWLSTRQSTRANVGLITTLMSEDADPTEFTAPEETLSYARSYVHEGFSFDLLTRAYREGEHAYLRLWMQKLQERAKSADALADAMSYVGDYLFAYIGAINGPLGEAYAVEHERRIRGGLAIRSDEVRAILAGTDVDVAEASARLRYRLDGRHVAFVIWRDNPPDTGPDRRFFEEIDKLGAQLAEVLDAGGLLLLPMAGYYAGWASVGASYADVAPDRPRLPASGGGTRLALGRAGRGLPGFRRSYEEALLAKRVASLAERPPACGTSFARVALDALMTTNLDEARQFVQYEIGSLLEDSDAARRLMATLEIFLEEESSFVRTARRLGVHENTVAYRVRRVEELLGRRVTERQLELRSALRLAHFVRRSQGDGAVAKR